MSRRRRVKIRHRGQPMIESLVTVAILAFAVMALAVYLQRAFQGYMYTNASSHGPQFDPDETYSDSRGMTLSQKVTILTTHTQGGTKTVQDPDELELPDITKGQSAGREVRTEVKTERSWSNTRNADFTARP